MSRKTEQDSIKVANKILTKFFNNTPKPLETMGDGSWKLRFDSTRYKTKVEDNEYTLWELPIRSLELKNKMLAFKFYIAISISLFPDDSIKSFNIKIFKDDPTKKSEEDYIPTELLLRAEWSNEVSQKDSKYIHAQPHWHIHAYKIDNYNISKLRSNDKQTIQDLIAEGIAQQNSFPSNENTPISMNNEEIPMLKFHLAMLADWDRSQNTQDAKELNKDSLNKWLPQCLNYIQDQIEYILGRISKVA